MNPTDPSARAELIFPWKARPVSFWRLLPGLLLCALVLGLLTLLFKVAVPRPAGSAALSASQAILLVNPDHPAAQGLLNRALDRSALLLGGEDSVLGADDRDLLPLFKPSFAGFEPRLKDPVNAPLSAPRQRLFAPEDLALPPLPAKASKPSQKPAPVFSLEPVWHGALAGLTLAAPPALGHLQPRDLTRLRFEIGVDGTGRVAVAAPLAAGLEDRDLVPAIQSVLGQARFQRDGDSRVLWGEVTFAWKRAKDTAGP